MAASAKSERDNAASVLRQALRRLDSLTKEKQIIKAMVTAEQQYTETIRLHIQYCSKKGEDQNAGAHLEWENTVGDSFNKSYTEAEDKLEVLRAAQQPPELTAKVKMNRTKAEIAVIEVEINSDIAALTEAVQAATLGKEAHDGLVVEKAKVDSRLTEHRVKSDQLLDLAMVSGEAEPEITALVENQKKFRTDLAPKLTSITTNLISKKPAETSQAPPRSGGGVRHDAAVVVGHGVEAPIPGSQRKQFIKYRPQEMPKFTGKAKDFALWKKLWQEGISPQFEESAQMMAFTTCLPEKVWKKIGRLDNITRVWDELDRHYGAPKIVTAEIMTELEQYGVERDKPEFIPAFTIMLEDAARLLDAIDRGDRVKSDQQVEHWVSMLPDQEQDRFFMMHEALSGSEWEKLMKFLSGRKRAIQEKLLHKEYVTSPKAGKSVDNKPDVKCAYPKCGKAGHEISNCRLYKADQNQIARRAGREPSGGRGFQGECFGCGETGHRRENCTSQGRGRVASEGGASRKRGEGQFSANYLSTPSCRERGRCRRVVSKDERCPGCQQVTKAGQKVCHCIFHCGEYRKAGLEQKTKIVKEAQLCVICLSGGHPSSACESRDPVCGLEGCRKKHHSDLHGSTDPYVVSINYIKAGSLAYSLKKSFHKAACNSVSTHMDGISRRREEMEEIERIVGLPPIPGEQVLLLFQEINIVYGHERLEDKIKAFWDDGSTCSLVKTTTAEHFQLRGEPITISIDTVNGVIERETKMYVVELINLHGERVLVRAFGVEKISGIVNTVVISGVRHFFSKEVQEKWDWLAERPEGDIELLIGSEMAGLHPDTLEKVGDLKVMKSQFGRGVLLTGRHPSISVESVYWPENVSAIRQGRYQLRQAGYVVNKQTVTISQRRDFFVGEEMGVYCPKRCSKCKTCTECPFSNRMLSEQEQFEYNLMEKGVKYDETRGNFKIQYPFLQDPSIALTDNWGQAVAMATSLEKRLLKEGFVDEFNVEFGKMKEKGAIVELSQLEMDQWGGAVHYIPMQLVHNPASNTTPFRVVTNSSCPDPVTRESLNSIMAKGPNCLADQWEVLLRFRNYEVPLTSDVTKAYHSMETGLLEKHLRRIIWRDCDKDAKWRVFAYIVVSFGDRPAAVLLEICIKRTIELFGHLDPEVAMKILRDRFVDDIATGGSLEQVLRYMGAENKETLQCDGTMPTILGKGGLLLKVIVPGGEKNVEKLEKLGRAVLGIPYSAETDTIAISFCVNIGKKRRGVKLEEDLTADCLDTKLVVAKLTPRILLGIVNSQYDPLGLVSPITVRLKKSHQELSSPDHKLQWDDEVVGELREKWVRLIEMMVKADRIQFQRSTRPRNAVGKPELIVYWDGSNAAAAAVVYIRWLLADNGVDVRLVASKTRITGLGLGSTVRVEMNGATLSMRLLRAVVRALQIPIQRAWVVGDSTVVLASREKSSAPFSEYYANRIGEQKELQQEIENEMDCPVGQWLHVGSKMNAADCPSRLDTTPDMLGPTSDWQKGPKYLYLPSSSWPFERDFADQKAEVKIPREELRGKYKDLPNHLIMKTLNSDAEDVIGECGNRQVVCRVSGKRVQKGQNLEDDNIVAEALGWGFSTNTWDTLIRKTAAIFRPFLEYRKRKLLKKGCLTDGELADLGRYTSVKPVNFWLAVATPATRDAMRKGKLQEYELMDYQGMVVLGTRANLGIKHYYGKEYLAVIMSSTRVAELVMWHAHCQSHKSAAVTVANSRKICYIIGARRLAKSMGKACIKCREVARKLLKQRMAPLPNHLQVPAPCFTHLGVDLAGPVLIKDMVVTRGTRHTKVYRKMWICVYVCLNTKAVKLYLVPGYSAEDFLLGWEQHINDCGKPATVHSDAGSNLASAAKDLQEEDSGDSIDFNEVARATGVTWVFAPPGAQFRNGCAEAFVKKLKHSLLIHYGEARMNVVEMMTALKRVACVINSCPLAAKDKRGLVMGALGSGQEEDSSHPDYLEPITANTLLLGRSGVDPVDREYELDCGPRKRLAYIRQMEQDWWEQYKLECFEYLLPTDKWRNSSDNITVGDLVLIKYEGKSKPGDYRWGIVTRADPDKDGHVRTATVRYSLIKRPVKDTDYKGISRKEITVAVQRLSRIYSKEEQEEDGIPGQTVVSTISSSPSQGDISTSPLPKESSQFSNFSTLSPIPNSHPISLPIHSHSSHSTHTETKPVQTSGMMRAMLFSVHQYETRRKR